MLNAAVWITYSLNSSREIGGGGGIGIYFQEGGDYFGSLVQKGPIIRGWVII